MSLLTNLTRAWLTRSLHPFVFRREYDEQLPYGECENLGLYVHIPFCESICSFCPYCKTLYSPESCSRYIDALLSEIHRVGGQTPGKTPATSLYFGGGSPALAAGRLGEIISALRQHFDIGDGIGIELHPREVTVPVLTALRQAGVTRISIGIQSFQAKFQKVLGRPPVEAAALAAALRAVPFETVSMDLIFALPGQTLADLRADVDTAFANGANHIAIYPLIDFTFTPDKTPRMPSREKRRLLDAITRYLLEKGCQRQSIWTFSSQPGAGYSSMTRENFLGFGCSATTLLARQFKINTFSVEEYCRRAKQGSLPTALTTRFTLRQRMVYYLFWAAYTTRVSAADFDHFFGLPLAKMYGLELWLAKRLGFATERGGVYEMTLKGAFYYHYYENFYTLAYIDKMWGILRREAFPERIEL